MRVFLQIAVVLLLFVGPCSALTLEDLRPIKNFQGWLLLERKDSQICYIMSVPFKTASYHGARSQPYLVFLYYGPGNLSLGVYNGLAMSDKGSSVLLGETQYSLQTYRRFFMQTANNQQDIAILNSILNLNYYTLAIRSYAASNELVLDYYSLEGFTDAVRYAAGHCKQHGLK